MCKVLIERLDGMYSQEFQDSRSIDRLDVGEDGTVRSDGDWCEGQLRRHGRDGLHDGSITWRRFNQAVTKDWRHVVE
jgi:hypothetical protein